MNEGCRLAPRSVRRTFSANTNTEKVRRTFSSAFGMNFLSLDLINFFDLWKERKKCSGATLHRSGCRKQSVSPSCGPRIMIREPVIQDSVGKLSDTCRKPKAIQPRI